jgi:CheY-like chemotaxis protein
METVPLALLADRDPDTRLLNAEYLRQFSYEIDEAEDGREALAKAISRPPSVIVTASRLPGISGFELCSLLRKDPSTSPIPIIVIASEAQQSEATLAEAAGADAVLFRPCPPERLATEIQRIFTKSDELRARGCATREKIHAQVTKSKELIARGRGIRRVVMSRAHDRGSTIHPPTPPRVIVCPECDGRLRYIKSHIGGVNERNPEQWDYFECPRGCGSFQYRLRTRKVRRVD